MVAPTRPLDGGWSRWTGTALLLTTLVSLVFQATPARAQSAPSLTLSFTPTARTQLAVWVERADGTFLRTLALTYAVANLGIGNRPGALQMNSGYRWPYGRREGVLPVWAHARAGAPEAKSFHRVIFQNRASEGNASRSRPDQSADTYYCLSFDHDTSERDALDAVTCPSIFSSDKGRFLTQEDVADGYSEPFEVEAGAGEMRPLSLDSLYPPRRDIKRCQTRGCYDHADVDLYAEHALEVMPTLDAVTRATPEGEKQLSWTFPLPADWRAEDDYVLYIEANIEGDYNDSYHEGLYPTPTTPSAAWDKWAKTFGYPYRGQPSVTYAIPFRLDEETRVSVRDPAGYGALHGEDGELRPLDTSMQQDPEHRPGSGADRLLLRGGKRATLDVALADPCQRSNAPKECGQPCTPDRPDCGELTCSASTLTCASLCVASRPAGAVAELKVHRHPDRLQAHTLAVLSFRTPATERPIASYQVLLRPEGGAWEQAFTPDSSDSELPVALDLCADPDEPDQNRCPTLAPNTQLEATLAGLKPSTSYEVEVRARDAPCAQQGETGRTTFSTPARKFATVAPCFVATAAYGSAWTDEVQVLRRFRDQILRPSPAGRVFIAFYETVGPTLAGWIEPHPRLRALTRSFLEPIVALARRWLA